MQHFLWKMVSLTNSPKRFPLIPRLSEEVHPKITSMSLLEMKIYSTIDNAVMRKSSKQSVSLTNVWLFLFCQCLQLAD